MGLSEQISSDLTAAMKARDREAMGTLRMVVAAIRNARVAEGHTGDVTDEEVLDLLAREAKRRAEAAEAYEAGGRGELAAKERRELEIIRRYLPAELTDDEVAAIVDEAVRATGADSPSDMGKVMAAVMPRVKGRADGKRVNALVRDRLGG
jgi:hypothetical protein